LEEELEKSFQSIFCLDYSIFDDVCYTKAHRILYSHGEDT